MGEGSKWNVRDSFKEWAIFKVLTEQDSNPINLQVVAWEERHDKHPVKMSSPMKER